MNLHQAFNDFLEPNNLVKQRQRRKIGLSGRKAAWYRWQMNAGRLSDQTKKKWLIKAGIPFGTEQQFSRTDMLEFLKFSRRQDSMRSAERLGDEYLFEKYLLWKQQGKPAVISTGIPTN